MTTTEIDTRELHLRALHAMAGALASVDGQLPYEIERGDISLQVRDTTHRIALAGALRGYGFAFEPFEPYRQDRESGWQYFTRDGVRVGRLYGCRCYFELSDVAAFGLARAVLQGPPWIADEEPPEDADDEPEPEDADEVYPREDLCEPMPHVARFQAHTYEGGVREYVEPVR